jgi:hypothetical protein
LQGRYKSPLACRTLLLREPQENQEDRELPRLAKPTQ